MKKFIKNNKILYYIGFRARKVLLFFWINVCGNVINFFRKDRKELLKYKNIHAGKRCFVVATGPSLTISDLEKIEKEYSFSMNSIVNIFDRTTYRPTYYAVQDELVEKKIRTQLLKSKLSDIFIGVGNIPGMRVNISMSKAKKYYEDCNWYNLDLAYHFYDMYYHPEKLNLRFNEDNEKIVYDGYTVTYSVLQLAIYMGFDEIYLLGCDANHSGHVDENNNGKSKDPLIMNIRGYQYFKKYADRKNVKIYNATRGGELEVFPRVDLDKLLKNKVC